MIDNEESKRQAIRSTNEKWEGHKEYGKLNRPCITKVKEVITGEKCTTIVKEYVRRDENLIEKFITLTMFSQKG